MENQISVREKRAAKAQALQVTPMDDDIHRDPSGSLMAGRWLATCESDPAMRHQVRFEGQALARWSCSCQDYRHHRDAEPSWACKHIAAVQARTQPQVPGATGKPAIGFAAPAITERERIDLECQAMFGDQAAIERLNGKPTRPSTYEPAPSMEVPRTPQPAAAALLDEPALEDVPEAGWIDCCPSCGRSIPECSCPSREQERRKMMYSVCQVCGLPANLKSPEKDGFWCAEHRPKTPAAQEIPRTTAEEWAAIEAPQAPYSWTPEQVEACRKEAAEIRAATEDFRRRFEAAESKAAPPAPTLASIHAALTRPFPIALVEVKPGAVANGKALALAFVDSRAYQARLDEVAGPDGWSVEYRPLGERAVICRLTILGVTREDVGEADAGSENAATCMIAQAFKRACASFGLGRYLYSLPKVWAELSGKQIKDPEAAIAKLYTGIMA